ncbi:hypothetical protein [Streptomyces sp. NPDC057623]|uniref:hypothetical protein n=1 Tax=Streptomyces sp. NPDC057623 TaxID=3346187 RepID=UPI0036BE74D3
MSYEVELAPWVEEVLEGLAGGDRQEVMGSIAAALVRSKAWPAPGGWAAATLCGQSWWISFAAYRDGIEVLDLGRVGGPSCTRWRSVV